MPWGERSCVQPLAAALITTENNSAIKPIRGDVVSRLMLSPGASLSMRLEQVCSVMMPDSRPGASLEGVSDAYSECRCHLGDYLLR